ncbi:MAG: segregation/condensation protein A [Planctomycetota bacterium]|nr:segregation/condensation protein A [Planctomycetota bacterium]
MTTSEQPLDPPPGPSTESTDFTVRLEHVFQGPLDLLLHLVREQEVEIHEIEISRVIDGFMDYVKALEKLDLEFAGEFLVMAATLMAIKSRSLLPTEEVDLEDDLDPRDELIQRLIEYRKFKGASSELEEAAIERAKLAERGWRGEVKEHQEEATFELGELTPWDLLASFSRLMREVSAQRTEKIVRDPRPLRWYVENLVENIRGAGRMTLRNATMSLGQGLTKESLIGTFCALLELVRLEIVEVRQDEQADEVELVLCEGEGVADRIASASFDDEEPEDEPEQGAELGAEAQDAPPAS